jgi:L,D-transpeptidase ErfK/SrfK
MMRTRRAPLRRRALPLLTLATVSWLAGCATMGTGTPTSVVDKQEPYLLLRLGERRLYVKEGGGAQPPEGYLVAVGRAQYPTPVGRFQINEMVVNPDFLVFDFGDPSRPNRGRIPPGINNPLGLRWIGFANAHGWAVGFHGTSKTQFLGQAVSHGCVRMRNDDIVKVFARVKVGTPVIVEP